MNEWVIVLTGRGNRELENKEQEGLYMNMY